MTKRNPETAMPEPQPMRRTLSGVENELGQCAGATRDRLDGLLAAEEVLPSISSSLGIEEELLGAYEQNSQDSLELARDRQAFKREEAEATRLEIVELEKKILNVLETFKGLDQEREAALGEYVECKKKINGGKSNEQDRKDYLNSVKNAKNAVKRLHQLRLEFDMWMKRLQSINKRSKVLQSPEVMRLVVHFQKMEKLAKR